MTCKGFKHSRFS